MKINLDEVIDRIADDSMSGFCIECGAERDGCEPDARNYACYECGKMAVYGAEELLLMYA